MGQPYTHGVWTVKPGREEEFVAAWAELAEWTAREVPGSGWAKLARDTTAPSQFRSFGPWRDAEAIEQWRGLPGFQQRVERIRALLDAFEPHTLELVVEVDQSDRAGSGDEL
ncbi:MAG: putative quinol monooxygenase [Solirubrobacteraceae bacterium]